MNNQTNSMTRAVQLADQLKEWNADYPDTLIGAEQIARLLCLPIGMTEDWIAQGIIPSYDQDGMPRALKSDLHAWLVDRETQS